MIHIAIVEDDDQYAATLIDYLNKYEEDNHQSFDIQRYNDGADIVKEYPKELDIILMDIEMEELDGMSAAERIRTFDKNVIIIFITNMAHYAMKGYAVEALDYVLKPINYFAFSQRISRALERLTKKKSKYLFISRYGNLKKVATNQLLYVEVHNHDIDYHLLDEVISVRGTLKELERELEPHGFFRCNSGCLVNLEFVEGTEGTDIIIKGDRIPVSRSKRKDFLDRMNRYLSEVGK